jgi:hypothetical protein
MLNKLKSILIKLKQTFKPKTNNNKVIIVEPKINNQNYKSDSPTGC